MLTPAQKAQMTRWQRLRTLESMQRHPSWDTERLFLNIITQRDMLILNNEVNARLAGGAQV